MEHGLFDWLIDFVAVRFGKKKFTLQWGMLIVGFFSFMFFLSDWCSLPCFTLAYYQEISNDDPQISKVSLLFLCCCCCWRSFPCWSLPLHFCLSVYLSSFAVSRESDWMISWMPYPFAYMLMLLLSFFLFLDSLIFSGVGQIPPAAAVNYVPWAIVGFVFQYMVRRRHFSYWTKYNCEWLIIHDYFFWATEGGFLFSIKDVLSAALDAGTAIGVILVYFWCVSIYSIFPSSSSLLPFFFIPPNWPWVCSLQYPFDGKETLSSVRTWWGNTVHKTTSDWQFGALRNATGHPFGWVLFLSLFFRIVVCVCVRDLLFWHAGFFFFGDCLDRQSGSGLINAFDLH